MNKTIHKMSTTDNPKGKNDSHSLGEYKVGRTTTATNNHNENNTQLRTRLATIVNRFKKQIDKIQELEHQIEDRAIRVRRRMCSLLEQQQHQLQLQLLSVQQQQQQQQQQLTLSSSATTPSSAAAAAASGAAGGGNSSAGGGGGGGGGGIPTTRLSHLRLFVSHSYRPPIAAAPAIANANASAATTATTGTTGTTGSNITSSSKSLYNNKRILPKPAIWSVTIEGKLLIDHLDYNSAYYYDQYVTGYVPPIEELDRSRVENKEEEKGEISRILFTRYFDKIQVTFQTTFYQPNNKNKNTTNSNSNTTNSTTSSNSKDKQRHEQDTNTSTSIDNIRTSGSGKKKSPKKKVTRRSSSFMDMKKTGGDDVDVDVDVHGSEPGTTSTISVGGSTIASGGDADSEKILMNPHQEKQQENSVDPRSLYVSPKQVLLWTKDMKTTAEDPSSSHTVSSLSTIPKTSIIAMNPMMATTSTNEQQLQTLNSFLVGNKKISAATNVTTTISTATTAAAAASTSTNNNIPSTRSSTGTSSSNTNTTSIYSATVNMDLNVNDAHALCIQYEEPPPPPLSAAGSGGLTVYSVIATIELYPRKQYYNTTTYTNANASTNTNTGGSGTSTNNTTTTSTVSTSLIDNYNNRTATSTDRGGGGNDGTFAGPYSSGNSTSSSQNMYRIRSEKLSKMLFPNHGLESMDVLSGTKRKFGVIDTTTKPLIQPASAQTTAATNTSSSNNPISSYQNYASSSTMNSNIPGSAATTTISSSLLPSSNTDVKDHNEIYVPSPLLSMTEISMAFFLYIQDNKLLEDDNSITEYAPTSTNSTNNATTTTTDDDDDDEDDGTSPYSYRSSTGAIVLCDEFLQDLFHNTIDHFPYSQLQQLLFQFNLIERVNNNHNTNDYTNNYNYNSSEPIRITYILKKDTASPEIEKQIIGISSTSSSSISPNDNSNGNSNSNHNYIDTNNNNMKSDNITAVGTEVSSTKSITDDAGAAAAAAAAAAAVVGIEPSVLQVDIDCIVPSLFPYRVRDLLRRIKRRELEYTSSRTKARYLLQPTITSATTGTTTSTTTTTGTGTGPYTVSSSSGTTTNTGGGGITGSSGTVVDYGEIIRNKVEYAVTNQPWDEEYIPIYLALAKAAPVHTEARYSSHCDARISYILGRITERYKATESLLLSSSALFGSNNIHNTNQTKITSRPKQTSGADTQHSQQYH